MQVIRRGSTPALRRALERARSRPATWTGDLTLPAPKGFDADEVQRNLGNDEEALHRAGEQVLTWGIQRHSGLAVCADSDRAEEGTTFVVGLPLGPVWVLAPCRVVDVTTSADRTAMTFVTLAGHPECGIEQFTVVRADTGSVDFEIRAVSRPASAFARLGRAVTRKIQVRQTRKYLAAADDRDG